MLRCRRRLVTEQGTNAVLRSRMERIQRQGANPAPGPAAAAAAAAAAGGRVGGGGPLAALLAPDVQEELKAARTRLGFQEQEVSVEPCVMRSTLFAHVPVSAPKVLQDPHAQSSGSRQSLL